MLFCTDSPSIDSIHFIKLDTHIKRNTETDINKRRYGPTYEMIYRFSGADEIRAYGKTFRAGAGSVEIMLPKDNTVIMSKTLESGKHINIFFTANSPIIESLTVIDASDNPAICTLFSKIHSVWTGKKDCYYLKALYLFYQILYELERTEQNSYLSGNLYARIEEGISYIQNNFSNSNFSHQTPSQICGVSYTYFQRLFQKKFKTTPVKYVTKLRMEMATDLLFTREYSIEEIARKTGYKNAYYFSRVFKETYGCPPTKYNHFNK